MEDGLVPAAAFLRTTGRVDIGQIVALQLGQMALNDVDHQGAILVKRHSEKNQAVTMRDVAAQSGFSPATVSIVLNNAPLARYIAPATKKRIEETAKKLGYRPNVMARFLRSKRSILKLLRGE